MLKKVLVLYAEVGQGHLTSARSIVQALKAKYPAVAVKEVNVLTYAHKAYQQLFVKGYEKVADNLPALWGFLYHHYNSKSRQKLFQVINKIALESKLIPAIKEYQPDFIVATHLLPAKLISFSKQPDLVAIPSAVVLTDFGCHSFWVDADVNYYFVATVQVGKCLEQYGVAPDRIQVTGIPIEQKFLKTTDQQALLAKFKLDPAKKTVLIVGGQFDLAALRKILKVIQNKNPDQVQFLVVAGRDKTLEKALTKSALANNSAIKIYGFVNNMEEMMSVADLIFSKAGGLTASECMAKGLPMVVNKVIPGQEEDNVDYLAAQGAAIKVSSVTGIITAVNDLLANPKKLQQMKKAALLIGRPDAAADIAQFIASKIK